MKYEVEVRVVIDSHLTDSGLLKRVDSLIRRYARSSLALLALGAKAVELKSTIANKVE